MVSSIMIINDLMFLLLFCCTFGWKSRQKCTTINKHIESIRRKPVSKPKPYKDIRGKYKWVVYFYDVQNLQG